MIHHPVRPTLDRFLDCELDPETRWHVAAHLAECDACPAYLAEQASLRALVRDRLAAVTVPLAVAARVRAGLAAVEQPAAAPPARPAWRPIRRAALVAGVAALLLLTALSAVWVRRTQTTGPRPDLAAELVTQHALFAHDESLFDVAGDGAVVRAWFRDKLGFAVVPPDVPDYELRGGRLTAVGARPAAQLVYEREESEDDARYLSLLAFDARPGDDPGPTAVDGFATADETNTSVVVWSARGHRLALVADLPPADLLDLALAIRPST